VDVGDDVQGIHIVEEAVTERLLVEVQKTVRAGVAPRFLRHVLEAAAQEPAVAGRLSGHCPELTVRVAGDRELRRLNREFLGEDRATDVLSFPSGEVSSGYLGDVALSWPAVVRQAAEHGHGEDVEAALLVVHGLLHLLGWDHASPREEREMTRLTLACLGRAAIVPAAGRLSGSPS
jgi:probable rRNA maturation factor